MARHFLQKTIHLPNGTDFAFLKRASYSWVYCGAIKWESSKFSHRAPNRMAKLKSKIHRMKIFRRYLELCGFTFLATFLATFLSLPCYCYIIDIRTSMQFCERYIKRSMQFCEGYFLEGNITYTPKKSVIWRDWVKSWNK